LGEQKLVKSNQDNQIQNTRMCGKSQPDGCPAVELIETLVLLISSCGPKYTCITESWSKHVYWRHFSFQSTSLYSVLGAVFSAL